MQTLSRYFVAFLLLLVSSFLEEKEPETSTQQASIQKAETGIKVTGPAEKGKSPIYRCS